VESNNNLTNRSLNRRQLIRTTSLGAGAALLSAGGLGRYLTASAQDATPSPAGFDAAACYQSFAGATPIKYDRVGDPPYNIALSNSYIGNVWRTQMINMSKAFVEHDDIKPMLSDYQIASSGEDASAQIAQMENMISSGAQAIIVNAISPTALNPTIQRARQDGVIIVAFDATVTAPDVVLVNEDQVEMGKMWAEFLVEQAGTAGKVLMINGVAGTSVDQDRQKGAKDFFAQYPDISLVEVVGKWDPGTAQTVTSQALAANDDITGVWCQGGTDGAVRAFLAANRPLVPFAGEAENGFRKQMLEYKDQFQGMSIGQSPGLVCVSIRVALDLLQGNEVPSSVAVPLPIVTTADLEPGVNVFPDVTDNFFVSINIPACGVDMTFDEIEAQNE
jgi:ribose transport system substrate-binding protein